MQHKKLDGSAASKAKTNNLPNTKSVRTNQSQPRITQYTSHKMEQQKGKKKFYHGNTLKETIIIFIH